MTVTPPSWYADPQARELFARFPLPLAIIDPADGDPLLNEHFGRLLDPGCLEVDPLHAVLRAADACWHPVRLRTAGGTAEQVQVQAKPIPGGVMLVVDRMPQTASPDLAQLHSRIAELEQLSATDRLTGAWNRAHFDRVLEVELNRSLRFRQPISLLLLDIDHFKQINDDHGHLAGDAVLQALVDVVQSAVRSADLLFRWGGEEFVVLAPSTGFRGAETLAESVRGAVKAHHFPVVEHITVSLGVAEHVSTETAQSWFARVDAALYAAKEAGRDRVSTDRQGSSELWAAEHGPSALQLVWQEAYESGHPLIDAEHRELFELANQAIAASVSADRERVLPAVDALLAHTRTHFSDEERVLAERGYERLDAHARVHASLLARAASLREAVVADRLTTGELIEFLAVEVVARHLFRMDRDFFSLFTPKG